jgi:hypothetical protein
LIREVNAAAWIDGDRGPRNSGSSIPR